MIIKKIILGIYRCFIHGAVALLNPEGRIWKIITSEETSTMAAENEVNYINTIVPESPLSQATSNKKIASLQVYKFKFTSLQVYSSKFTSLQQ